MSESDDLLAKADAFLKRYRSSGTLARDDVPVLTEIIAAGEARSAQISSDPPASGSPARPGLDELELKLKQSILEAVASSIEEPVRARLEAHLQKKLAELSVQIKADLETLIRNSVKRTIELEIARRRTPSRRT